MAYLPASLVAPIRHIAKQALGKDWQLYGILLDHWPTIVGDAWAELIHPVKLSFPVMARSGQRQALCDGVLTLRLPRGLALEVQYRQQQIIERVNNFFGAKSIARLILTHTFESPRKKVTPIPLTPADRDAIRAATAGVPIAELRDALESLGAFMHTGPR